MFEQVADSFISLKKYKLLHLFHSLNEPLISPAGGVSPQPTTCHMMILQDAHQAIEIAVGLHFPEAGERMLYKSPKFQSELYSERLAAAQAFVDQMGFIMDNSNIETALGEGKSNLLRAVPFFYESIELFHKALNSTEIKFRKWKTEASTDEAPVDNQKVFLEQYLKIVSML